MKPESFFYGDVTRWFIGRVVNINDPLALGRVQVRIFGIHSENLVDIPQSDIPWAQTVIPVTEGGTSGIGNTIGIKNQAQVFGVFLDGKNSQLPLVLGSVPKYESESQKRTYEKTKTSSLYIPDAVQEVSFSDNGYNTLESALVDTTYLSGNSNIEKAYNFFISSDGGNFTSAQSAGIVGNFLQESGTGGDLNPRALAKGEGSFGIAQWNPSEAAGNRLGGLYSWAASKNLSPSNLYTQLLYTKRELTSYAYLGLGQLREATTPAEASVVFEKKYERPAAGSTDSRIKYSEEIYEKMEEGAAV